MVVRQGDDLNPGDFEGFHLGIERHQGELGQGPSFPWNMPKGVGELLFEFAAGPGMAVERNRLTLPEVIGPQVIDAMGMVGVRMRIKDGVEAVDLLAQRLLPEVGASVDDEALLRAALAGNLPPERDAQSLVPGVLRQADLALAADDGHSGRGAAAE